MGGKILEKLLINRIITYTNTNYWQIDNSDSHHREKQLTQQWKQNHSLNPSWRTEVWW
jgi:hypothetical protein